MMMMMMMKKNLLGGTSLKMKVGKKERGNGPFVMH
ncbi:hypothetical protein EC843_10184 [Buttiauxella sp. JUb87]|nr:hypothetical protein EC843_10184 [Buttiauxella sp. JUb87]